MKRIRKRIKEFLRRHGLWGFTSSIWYFRRNLINPPLGSLNNILDKYLTSKNNAFFIQIGSNDGSANDPLVGLIKKYNLAGILVEPMDDLFNKLRTNYAGQSGLIFENSAISADFDGQRDFYYLQASPEKMASWPVWYTQLGSFMPEIIERHECRIPDIKEYITSRKISCLTFKSLVNKHNIKRINLLCIDTEGYDFEILKTVDLSTLKPDIVIYEPIHLKDREYAKCNKLLKNHGYMLYWDSPNIIATRNNIL